ncbi:MAG: hypothetical protein KC468_09295 [Myxococcales bacterium]|nr:hypothetical protein [Myxococcales bacterium]
MDLRKVQAVLNEAEENFMGGMVACDVFNRRTGMPIANIRGNPKACALFNFLAERINESVSKSHLSLPDDFEQLMISFPQGLMMFMINLNDEYRWGVLVNTAKASMGIAVSVVFPTSVPELRTALS